MAAASRGFTLIEMLVVLSLVSLMLFIAIARLPETAFIDAPRKTITWLVGTIRTLKQKAVTEQKDYLLNVDIAVGRLWVTDETMSTPDRTAAESAGYALPAGLQIHAVELTGREPLQPECPAVYFSKKGYSDMALVYLDRDGSPWRRLRIEPFLPMVKIYAEEDGFNH